MMTQRQVFCCSINEFSLGASPELLHHQIFITKQISHLILERVSFTEPTSGG